MNSRLSSMPPSERRSYPRIPLVAPARLLDEDGNEDYAAQLRGAVRRWHSDRCIGAPHRDGSQVELVVDVGGGREIHSIAEVVRVDGVHIGFRFVDLAPASLDAILDRMRLAA